VKIPGRSGWVAVGLLLPCGRGLRRGAGVRRGMVGVGKSSAEKLVKRSS
jgi:hypothetical protein